MSVVLTGGCALSGAGVGTEALLGALLAGRRLAETVPGLDPTEHLGKTGLRHFDRTALLLCSAARLALDGAGLPAGQTRYAPEEQGVVVGSTHGSIQAIAEFDQEAVREGPKYVNPQAFANTVINAPAGRVSILFGLTGLNSTLSTGRASALDALDYAARMLRAGRIGAVVWGSALGASPEIARGYGAAGVLVERERATPPFAAEPRGSALAEGAAAFVLEDGERARGRGAPIHAAVTASSTDFDPRSGEAAQRRTVEAVLERAGVAPAELACAFAGAVGRAAVDRVQGDVLAALLPGVPVTAVAGATGDCLEATPALALAAAAGVLAGGAVPPIAGLAPEEARADLDLVLGSPRPTAGRHVLVTACDESGHAAAVLVSAVP